MKMIDPKCFIKPLKITWICRLYYSLGSTWVAKHFIGESKNEIYLHSQWTHEYAYQMSKPFRKDFPFEFGF